jgi:AmiR/NasT family two-component response regulator
MALDVESVLRTRRFEAMLDQFAGDLEDQLEERKIIAEAKDLLQATQGITEEETYSPVAPEQPQKQTPDFRGQLTNLSKRALTLH